MRRSLHERRTDSIGTMHDLRDGDSNQRLQDSFRAISGMKKSAIKCFPEDVVIRIQAFINKEIKTALEKKNRNMMRCIEITSQKFKSLRMKLKNTIKPTNLYECVAYAELIRLLVIKEKNVKLSIIQSCKGSGQIRSNILFEYGK